MDELLKAEDFDIKEYHRMRRQLNSVIESTLDEEMRTKLETHGIVSKSPEKLGY